MKTHLLVTEQFVKKPIEEVFAFFKRPENLEKITPGSLAFQILTPKPIEMEKGRVIDYTIRVLGLRQRWTTLITTYSPPYLFVDEQIRGPYDFWHHTHKFSEKEGGTVITDEVRYAMPLGILGNLAHTFFVENQLRQIFEHRKQVIEDIFGDREKAGGRV